MSDAASAASPFYATATAVLLALLITWLVAEARGLRDDAIATRDGGDATVASGSLGGGFILAVAAMLTAGALTALRVQFLGRIPQSWEVIVVWAALGLGLAGVALSLARNVYTIRTQARAKPTLRALDIAKHGLPPLVAVACGVLASPLVYQPRTRFVGARFDVYGTCVSNRCGLRQRRGPGPGFPEVHPRQRLTDGTPVLVVCQIAGQPPKGYRSRVWDLLTSGTYVSDVFVRTPNRRGGFSSELARCRPGASG